MDNNKKEQEELVDFDELWDIEVEDNKEDLGEIDDDSNQDKDKDPLENVDTEALDKELNKDNDDEDNKDKEEGEDPDKEEKDPEEVVESSIIGTIREQLGYDDLEGEFEDTEEGVVEFTKLAAQRMADDFVDQTFTDYPVMKDFFEYVNLGGDPKHFLSTQFPEMDYASVEFDENDTELQERLVKEELVASGYKGEELEAELSDIKNGGILESKAKRSLAKLKAKQQEDRNGLVEQQRQEQQKIVETQTEFWNNVKSTIKEAKEFNGLRVPESDKSKFIEYLTKPVKDGKTQRDLDIEKAQMQDTLAIDFLFFKGFKLDDIIKRRAKDEQAKSLKDRLRKSKLDKHSENRSNSTSATEELGDL